MNSTLILFPRKDSKYRWYEILDNSLVMSHIVCGDVIECHPDNALFTNALYVVIFCGHVLVRYLYYQGQAVTMIPACRHLPLIFAKESEIAVVGRVLRCFHKGRWYVLQEIPADNNFWQRWAIEEAS